MNEQEIRERVGAVLPDKFKQKEHWEGQIAYFKYHAKEVLVTNAPNGAHVRMTKGDYTKSETFQDANQLVSWVEENHP